MRLVVILRSVFNVFNIYKKKFFQVLERVETLPKIIAKCILRVCLTMNLESISTPSNTRKIKIFKH